MSKLRYRAHQKLRDRARGKRDGRDCVPSLRTVQLLAEEGEAFSAPYPDVLLSQALQHIAAEHENFEQQVHSDRTALGRLREEWKQGGETLVRAAQLVTDAHAPLTEEELRPRSYDELLPGNRQKLINRCDTRRFNRITQARAQLDAHQAARDEIGSRIAVVEERIRNEFVAAQAAARTASEHFATRIQAYWEHNVHIHPEGVHIAALLRYTAQLLPSWVLEEPDGDPAELGRGPFELHHLTKQVVPPVRRTGRKEPYRHIVEEIEEPA